MRSALKRLRNAASTQPPVPMAPYGYRSGSMFDLGTGRASKEQQLRAYGMSGTVYSIVSLLQSAAAFPDWHLYKKQPVDGRRRYSTADSGDDQRTEVVSHAALSLWNKPNPFQTGFEFREGSNQHLELAGETFWVLDMNAGFPVSLWYVRPDRMEPVPDENDYLVGWVYTGFNGEQVPLKLNEVIQEKLPDPLDPFRGSSPIASILPNIQQQRYATEYMRNVFLNGAQPDGIVQLPNKMSDREFDEFTDRWRESHQGVSRAGRVGILENGATWVPGTQTNRDLEYGNLRLANRDEIREAWRMHKSMLGTVEDVNRANAETAEETFAAWQEIPRLERRKNTLNCKLLPLFGTAGENVEFDYDDPSPVNQEAADKELLTKAQAAQALVNAGYDPHDVLEVVGLPDMDVAEKATQAPALPPGWVSESGSTAQTSAPAPVGGSAGTSDRLPAREQITMRNLRPLADGRQDQDWPGWSLDMQAVAYWAPLLTAAATGALTKARAAELAAAYLAAHPDAPPDGAKREANAAAAAWLTANGFSLVPAVTALIPAVMTDAYLIGAASAAAAADAAASAAAAADAAPADTGDWEPGDSQAARQRIDALGLSASLGTALGAAPQAAQQTSDSYTLAVGTALVDGVIAGASAAAVAAMMTAALSTGARASAVVLDHVSMTVGSAAMSLYAKRGIASGAWLTEGDAKVDPVCAANAAASPLPIGSAYPSGDSAPPAHNSCRCALVPAPDDGEQMAARLRKILNDGYVPVESPRRG